jgi:hypothetical protein
VGEDPTVAALGLFLGVTGTPPLTVVGLAIWMGPVRRYPIRIDGREWFSVNLLVNVSIAIEFT